MRKRINLTRSIALILLLLATTTLAAQKIKPGKPSQKDWDFVGWGEAPDAEAVVLAKTVNAQYAVAGDFAAYDSSSHEISMNNLEQSGMNKQWDFERTSITYKCFQRIKILKDSGKGYANLDIVYYNDAQDMDKRDDIHELFVTVFRKVGGKVKKTLVPKEDITDEQLDENYRIRHIRVKDAEAGSIIECRYELFSRRICFLYDWQMQERIPVMLARYEAEIPAFLTINVQVPNHPFIKKGVTGGTISKPLAMVDYQAPKQCRSNVYNIECKDILPISLDKLRRNDDAKGDEWAKAMFIRAQITAKGITPDIPLPKGMRHIMLNP